MYRSISLLFLIYSDNRRSKGILVVLNNNHAKTNVKKCKNLWRECKNYQHAGFIYSIDIQSIYTVHVPTKYPNSLYLSVRERKRK